MMTIWRCEASPYVNRLIKSGLCLTVCVHFVKNRFLFCAYDTISVSLSKSEKWDCGHVLNELDN